MNLFLDRQVWAYEREHMVIGNIFALSLKSSSRTQYIVMNLFLNRQVWANSVDQDQSSLIREFSGSTLFAIPSASFGCIILWQSHLLHFKGDYSNFFRSRFLGFYATCAQCIWV